MNILSEDTYCTFALDEHGSLWLNWKESTASMTAENFKETLVKNGELAKEHHAANTAVDIRQFKWKMTPEVGKWRVEVLFPIYIDAGIRKQAFLGNEKIPAMVSDGTNTAGILVDSFVTADEVNGWFGV